MKANMDKKQYITPLVKAEFWNTHTLMDTGGGGTKLPPAPGLAPERKPSQGHSEAPVF